jgi:hypothetical protein
MNKDNLIEFAKEQCKIFPEDSYMGEYLRETIKILEDKTIPLDKVKQAREEMEGRLYKGTPQTTGFTWQNLGVNMCLEILDKLIKEVEA